MEHAHNSSTHFSFHEIIIPYTYVGDQRQRCNKHVYMIT